MNKTRVCFFSTWASPAKLLQDFQRFTPKGNGVWGAIKGVASPRDADYYVVLDGWQKKQKAPTGKPMIYLQREPLSIQPKRPAPPTFQFYGSFERLLKAATPWILKPYSRLKALKYKPRPHALVAICSGKTSTQAHRQRLALIRALCKHLSPAVFHVYGRGLKASQFNGCYRGEIKGKCKHGCLSKYRYCLALENDAVANYVTEKLYDCYLSLTLPIYWGAPNVGDYFPEQSIVALPTLQAKPEVIQRIKACIATETLPQATVDALMKAKALTLDRYGLWPMVEQIVSKPLQ